MNTNIFIVNALVATLILSGCGKKEPSDSQVIPPPASDLKTSVGFGGVQPEGFAVSISGIAGVAGLASESEIRLFFSAPGESPRVRFVRAAILPKREGETTITSTRSANDRYLSILLKNPVKPPAEFTLLLTDTRTLKSAVTTVTLTAITPSPDDTRINDLVTSGSLDEMKRSANSLMNRMQSACNGGDYDLVVTLAPHLADVCARIVAAKGTADEGTRTALAHIRDSATTFTTAAKAVDDGVMGTTVELLKYDFVPRVIGLDPKGNNPPR